MRFIEIRSTVFFSTRRTVCVYVLFDRSSYTTTVRGTFIGAKRRFKTYGTRGVTIEPRIVIRRITGQYTVVRFDVVSSDISTRVIKIEITPKPTRRRFLPAFVAFNGLRRFVSAAFSKRLIDISPATLPIIRAIQKPCSHATVRLVLRKLFCNLLHD